MSKQLKNWYPEILPNIPNLPLPALQNAVRNAAIKFLSETYLWTLDLARIDIVSGTAEYDLIIPGNIKSSPSLAIGTTKTNVASNSFSYEIKGVIYNKAAVAIGTAPGDDVIPQNKYGAVAFDIDEDGNITAVEATANATGYATAALAIAGILDADPEKARMGTVTAMKTDGDFTFGTTDLDADNTTVAYTNATITDNGILYAIERVLYKADGEEDSEFITLDPTPQDQKDLYTITPWRLDNGPPAGYYHKSDISPLILTPIPDANSTEGLLVTVVRKPNYTDTRLPDFVYNSFFYEIAVGAKYYLYGEAGQTWYNNDASLQFGALFEGMIKQARINVGALIVPSGTRRMTPKV